MKNKVKFKSTQAWFELSIRLFGNRVDKTREQRERARGTPRDILRNTQAQTQHQTTKFNKLYLQS